MPRACTVCTHPQRQDIDLALVRKGDGNHASYRDIARQFGIAHMALKRHHDAHVGVVLARHGVAAVSIQPVSQQSGVTIQDAAAARVADERSHAISVMTELGRQVDRVRMLSDACDRWLRDPDDATQYDISPRGEDVTVIYWGKSLDGKPQRKKTTLGAAMMRLEQGGTVTERAEFKVTDPRDLLIKASQQVTAQMNLVVTVLEALYNAQEVERFQATVLDAIGEVAPDVRSRIEDSLHRHNPVRGVAGAGIGRSA